MVKKLVSLFGLSAILMSGTLHAQWIAGYFESNNGVESVSQIPWNKYTHIIHFAATTGGTGDVQLHWLNQTEIQQIIAARPAGKKVLVCIQDNGSNTSAMMNSTSPTYIGTFVQNIVNFVNTNGYDGVDLDWEINISATQYAALFQQLRAAMPNKLITTAMSNGSAMISAAAAAYGSIDQINMMCYDMDSPGNGYSWYDDALLQNGNTSVMTCDWRVNPMLNAGVPASKIGIGLPFYGRRWSGVTKALVNGSFSTSTVLYKDLVTDSTRWQSAYQMYDSGYKSDYLSIPSLNEFDSYNGTRSMADAASWIKNKGFGGAMTFSLYYEFLSGQSGDARYPLSTALYSALGSSSVTTVTPPSISGGQPSGTLASSTTQATMSVVTNENASCKYATTAGVSYASMPNMFSTTGGTTSSTLLTGLSAGNSYNYYVRCADSAGNADTSDYTVSFSIAAITSTSGSTTTGGTTTTTTSTPPAALGVSASPFSGSGSAQTFTYQISDPSGYSAVKQLDTFIGTQVGTTNNCRVQWNGGTTLYLQNDAATSWTSGAAGGSGTLSNSQCSIGLAGSSVSGSGYVRAINLAVTFASAYAGTKNIYGFAADSSTTTGWKTIGSWTVATSTSSTTTSTSTSGSTAPTALTLAATPTSGSGSAQTFTYMISDPAGYAAVKQLDSFIGTQVGATNSCRVQWNGGTTLYLQNDAATGWTSGTAGGWGTLSNSQCSVNLAGSSVSGSGYVETIKVALNFASAYAGTKNIYGYAADSGTTGWKTLGTWTVTTVQPPTITGSSPTGTLATSTTQTTMSVVTNMNATCKYGTTAGTAYSSMPYMFATTGGTTSSVLLSGLTAGSSYTYYARCADAYGNASTTDYPVSFAIAASAPTKLGVAVNPGSGSGTHGIPQTFTFMIQDPNGYSGVGQLDTFFGTVIGGANNCRVQWNGGTTLYMQNDAATGWISGTVGSNSSLSNSQCSLNLLGSSVSGTGYAETLKLQMTFSSAYLGTKNIYAFAWDKSGISTNWLTLGSWTIN